MDTILLSCVIGLLGVIQTYLQLQCGNWAWWWRSFWTGASGGIYMGIYSVVYLFTELDFSAVDSDLIYLIYMVMFIGMYMLMAGAVSVFGSYLFVTHIYGSIKGE